MKNNLLLICLFIMALCTSQLSMAQSLTTMTPELTIAEDSGQDVEVILDLEGTTFDEWLAPSIDGDAILTINEANTSSLNENSTYGLNGISLRKVWRITAISAGTADVIIQAAVILSGSGGVIEIVKLVIKVIALARTINPQELPIIEQEELAIDYLAIKED